MEILYTIVWTLCVACTLGAPGLRLAGGPTPYSGRVEVLLDGQWGTVCHRRWTEDDARVACRELGFLKGGKAIRNAAFGEGNISISMAYVECRGNETSLSTCPYRSGRGCGHDEDAGVVCNTDTVGNKTGQARLSDGNTNTSGRVEIQYNGVWGSVCRDNWNIANSKIVCRDMGFCGGSSVMHDEGAFGTGTGPVWLTNVNCSGHEEHLAECQHDGWANNSCEHHSDVGVVCNYCPTGSIRLVGSDNNSSGIVSISNSGVWGTICDAADTWSDSEARVVCRSIGFAEGFAADYKNFDSPTGPIWLSGVQCSGWEKNISSCDHDGSGGWGENNCRHYQDVAVNCTMTPYYTSKSSKPPVSFTTPLHTTQSTLIPQPQVSTTPKPGEKPANMVIVIVSVVVVAVVVIVVVIAIVCGVTRIKTHSAKHSILLTPRGQTNEYMISSDTNAEGACALALVPMSSSKRESGVYQEIDEKKAATNGRHTRNTYTDEPGACGRTGYRAEPLPSIPGEDEPGYLTSAESRQRGRPYKPEGATGTDQDHYAEIPDNNVDYLTPLKLKC